MLQMSVEPTANRAPVAQWIEHLTSDQRVGGSNPSGRATFPRETARLFEAEGLWGAINQPSRSDLVLVE